MNSLERLVVGDNSFTTSTGVWDVREDPNSHFYLKNCPSLRDITIGRLSFSDYTICEIKNVDALETIEIGDLNENSENFSYALLELKSIIISVLNK